jgi:dienelactone hydrolase
MQEEAVTIQSAGLKLSGTVRVPDGVKAGEKRAAFLVLHGFGSSKNSGNVRDPSKVLNELGYVTLGFDMRGCGDSEGEHGRVICLEQVEYTRNALSFLAKHPAVDPGRIGLIGSSFGGAVAVYAGGSTMGCGGDFNGGWGDGDGNSWPAQVAGGMGALTNAGRRPEHRAKPAVAMVPRRHHADRRICAPTCAECDPRIPGRDRAEHVDLPTTWSARLPRCC